jgi:hypothetical protein
MAAPEIAQPFLFPIVTAAQPGRYLPDDGFLKSLISISGDGANTTNPKLKKPSQLIAVRKARAVKSVLCLHKFFLKMRRPRPGIRPSRRYCQIGPNGYAGVPDGINRDFLNSRIIANYHSAIMNLRIVCRMNYALAFNGPIRSESRLRKVRHFFKPMRSPFKSICVSGSFRILIHFCMNSVLSPV